MAGLTDITAGDWALCFHELYMHYADEIAGAVERLQTTGAGWDWVPADQLMLVVRVADVKPKTYWDAKGIRRRRAAVIASLPDEGEALALREGLYAVGKEASERIDAEVSRLAAPIEERERAKALAEIRAALPHLFQGRSGSDTQPHRKRDRIEGVFTSDHNALEDAGNGVRDKDGTAAGHERDSSGTVDCAPNLVRSGVDGPSERNRTRVEAAKMPAKLLRDMKTGEAIASNDAKQTAKESDHR